MQRFLLLLICWICLQPIAYGQNSLLWEVSGNGLKRPSYLFGTMHVSESKFFEFGHRVYDAIGATDVFMPELDTEEMGMAGAFSALGQMMMPGDHRVSDMISEEDYHLLDSIFELRVGMSVKVYDKMEPMMLIMLMTESMDIKEEVRVMDDHLMHYADSIGKKVNALETWEEQLTALKAIPYEKQALMLIETVHEILKDEEMNTQLEDLYLMEDIEGMQSFFDSYKTEGTYDEFDRSLIISRNRVMLERMLKQMKKKEVFVAVGCLHLPGESGLIRLLREKGYTVNPVYREE